MHPLLEKAMAAHQQGMNQSSEPSMPDSEMSQMAYEARLRNEQEEEERKRREEEKRKQEAALSRIGNAASTQVSQTVDNNPSIQGVLSMGNMPRMK